MGIFVIMAFTMLMDLFCLLYRKFNLTILFVFFALAQTTFAQPPNCTLSPTVRCNPVGGGSVYLMTSSNGGSTGSADFTFDTMGKYLTGITQSGVTTLKLTVTELAAPCRWQLHANIDNGGVAPNTEWELVTPYSAAGPPHALINLLQLRIRNECNTSLSGTGFVNIANTGANIDIVESPGVSIAPGACTGVNVNRPGSYLTNYGEFSFTVDYRIVFPALVYRPGVYQVTVRYCLTEDI